MTAEQQASARRIIENLSWHHERVRPGRRQDLQQEAWLAICQGGYDLARGPWHKWVWATAHWAMADYAQRDRVFGPRRHRPEEPQVPLADDLRTTTLAVRDPWVVARVRQLWASLTTRDREALRMCRLPRPVVSAATGESPDMVHWRRKEAKRRAQLLAQRLGLRGVEA